MSSIPGYTLEEYMEWNYWGCVPEECAKLYEPHREAIEYWLSDFDEETQNWRDYAPGCPFNPEYPTVGRPVPEP